MSSLKAPSSVLGLFALPKLLLSQTPRTSSHYFFQSRCVEVSINRNPLISYCSCLLWAPCNQHVIWMETSVSR
jgi:hypothetical protein